MKDATRDTLEASRPELTPREAVSYCLGRLFADRSRRITETIVPGLTFEELIGALLLARDVIVEAGTD